MSVWPDNSQHIIPAERLKKELLFIEQNGSGEIHELAVHVNVSEATIRRDLDELVKFGSVERTHGGAILTRRSTSFEHIYKDKMNIQLLEKKRIGALAATHVEDGDTLLLDSGTTTYQIAQNLREKRNLTVITYDLSITNSLRLHPSSTVIMTGGIKREGYNVLVGSITENFIRGLKVDKVFLAADAVDVDFGISNANFIETGIKTALIGAGKKIILAADKTKFGKTAVSRVCGIDDIQLIITDGGISRDLVREIESRGVKVQLA